jgi:hypothetical protein
MKNLGFRRREEFKFVVVIAFFERLGKNPHGRVLLSCPISFSSVRPTLDKGSRSEVFLLGSYKNKYYRYYTDKHRQLLLILLLRLSPRLSRVS